MQKIGCLLLFVALISSALEAEENSSACGLPPKSWSTYMDHAHGFCFLYPSVYRREHNKYDKQGTMTLRRVHSDGRIYIVFEDKGFDVQRFKEYAPTGYESPPEATQYGPNTFYYYGPGGGGVSYADRFFCDLKGKTLYITFDGPYPSDDKSPTAETKDFEGKILTSFRSF
jgi:hypothetical protein